MAAVLAWTLVLPFGGLADAARSEPGMESADLFTAGALVMVVRRMLDTVVPRED